jgi:phospholipid transport system transporter-binding protein
MADVPAGCPEAILLEDAPAVLQVLCGALPPGATEFDLAPLRRFDSSAIAVLLALRRQAGGRLAFRNPPANLRTLASLYGVDALLFGPHA